MFSPVDVNEAARISMLRMGKAWHSLGKVNQAVDTYLRVLEEYPDAEEAEEARRAVLSIAAGFESEGQYHLSMHTLDRLREAMS
ncbi:MAG: tetratricopeptide repeat protein [Anaerolineae bacterium]